MWHKTGKRWNRCEIEQVGDETGVTQNRYEMKQTVVTQNRCEMKQL